MAPVMMAVGSAGTIILTVMRPTPLPVIPVILSLIVVTVARWVVVPPRRWPYPAVIKTALTMLHVTYRTKLILGVPVGIVRIV